VADDWRSTDSRKPPTGHFGGERTSERASPPVPLSDGRTQIAHYPEYKPAGWQQPNPDTPMPRVVRPVYGGMMTMEMISEEMARRRTSQEPQIQRMLEVRDRYNADVVSPVWETDDDDPLAQLTPMLIADAVDHPALYAAQVPPNIYVPALNPAKTTGMHSADFAARRRKALYYSWDESWWELVFGRFYRHLAGYASSALVVELDEEGHFPRIVTRDPLTAYPEPKSPEDLTMPANVGFIKGKSLDWLHHHWPETRTRFPKGSGYATQTSAESEIWDIVEWMDTDEIVLGVLGPRDAFHSWTSEPIKWAWELGRYPNLLGRCPAVVPRRVTLDRIMSQLANLTGHSDMMAKLLYLDIKATERSIFPDKYVIAKTGQNPSLVAGHWMDGASGEINMVIDADAIGNLPATPDPNNKATMDRLERNFRVSSGLIPQAGGETYGALRTGRGIDALMGAALDPRTTELHRIAERYFAEVNELVLLSYRKAWPSRTFSVYSPLDPGAVDFVPEKHVELDQDGTEFVDNRVTYAIPGMDDINATQVIGQMMGANLVSGHDARRMHPHVRDPEGTERRLLVEALEGMNLQSLAARAAEGGIPPEDSARMIELAYTGLPLHEIIKKVNEEASARQTMQEPTPEQMAPGLANPGEGAEAGMMGEGMISGQGTNLERMSELVRAVRTPPGGQG
jgi:hypothetical protein